MNRSPIRMLTAAVFSCALGFSAEAGAERQPSAQMSLYSTPYSFVELVHVSAEAVPGMTHEPSGSPRLAGEAPRMLSQPEPRAAQWSSAQAPQQVAPSAPLSRPAGWLAALSVLAVLAFIFVRRAQPFE